MTVTDNNVPVAGAQVIAKFTFPDRVATCTATTDSTGVATCAELVPNLPDGTLIYVQVNVATPDGQSDTTSTSFTIQRAGH